MPGKYGFGARARRRPCVPGE